MHLVPYLVINGASFFLHTHTKLYLRALKLRLLGCVRNPMPGHTVETDPEWPVPVKERIIL